MNKIFTIDDLSKAYETWGHRIDWYQIVNLETGLIEEEFEINEDEEDTDRHE